MVAETLNLRGRIALVHTGPQGQVLQTFEQDNLIVQVGKNFLASAMLNSSSAPFTHMAVGSSGTAAALADTTLGAELTRTAFSFSSVVTNVVTMEAAFGPGVGTGAWQEAGLLNAASAGTLFSRVIFSVVNKGALDTITLTWTVTIG